MMRYALIALIAWSLLALGCKPVADSQGGAASPQDAAPAPQAAATEVDWLVEFRRVHGTPFDSLSRIDREKMARLQGQAPTPVATPTPRVEGDVREKVITVASGLIGLRETHGANRAPRIDEMNRLTGVPMGSPWCASANAWIYNQAGVPGNWPRSAWSPDWVKSPTWTRERGGRAPKPGDAFGIWFATHGRVAHTGLVEQWGDTFVTTLEGNTGASGSVGESDRDGDGYYRKRRLRSQIYSVRDWINE